MAHPPALLTNLLNTLHTHLQSQTQLLPTLHAQLGLPPTALEDELKALQQKLMHSVEVQVESRMKEVEKWLEKCEKVELECVRYSNSLGGNIKATGTSVSELAKEQVLPRRFETVSEYQEKLRQLYHTKLEQLTTLTGRLNAFARTLGPEFFSTEVLQPTLANGGDPEGHRDVTPERFSKLEKELVRGKAEVSKRLVQLSGTLAQIDWLYGELGMSSPVTADLTPSSASTSSAGRSTLSANMSSDPFRVPTPTPGTRGSSSSSSQEESEENYQRIFARFVARVEEAVDEGLPENPHVPIGLENVDPTQGLISWANKLQTSLEDVKRRREAHIQAMYDQLEGLWKRLGVHEQDMDAFVEEHRGSTEEVVREYEEELERMMELKRERMGVFVGSAREEIVKLWDELMIGEDEREDFAPFADDEHTEELLIIHEEEIRRLKEEKRMKAPLLAGIKKYFEICDEEKELSAAANDQTRLLGRGSRDPGRLLREEKMRKRVSKEKPRLEQDLLASIPVWEEGAGRPFLVHGESILQMLMRTVSSSDQENANKRRAGGPPPRAGSVPPRATTPVSQSYAPGKTGVVTPAIRPASSNSNSQPNKRMKMGDNFAPAGRAPLGSSRIGNGRSASPSKIPHKRSDSGNGPSSLPRPAYGNVIHVAMPIPKPGTQHHALGHGRVPTSGVFSSAYASRPPSATSSISSLGYSTNNRYASAGGGYAGLAAKKGARVKRESFKPRPSIDGMDLGVGGRWTGLAGCVKEEEEAY